jgi:hypothetical protein
VVRRLRKEVGVVGLAVVAGETAVRVVGGRQPVGRIVVGGWWAVR